LTPARCVFNINSLFWRYSLTPQPPYKGEEQEKYLSQALKEIGRKVFFEARHHQAKGSFYRNKLNKNAGELATKQFHRSPDAVLWEIGLIDSPSN